MPRTIQISSTRQVEIIEQPTAVLKPGHLRVRTRYSGISAGTELTAYRGTNPYLNRSWDPHARLFTKDTTELNYPIAGLGYSEVGEVLEVADDVRTLPGAPRPGQQIWGIWGHRSEAVLPVERVAGQILPDGLDPLAATFARVGAVALNGILAADIHLAETVAVFGQGVLGLLTTRMVNLSGARAVAVDTVGSRLRKAAEYGAAVVIDASDGGTASRLRDLTGNRGVDVAIEISGSYRALHEAIRSVAVAGRVVAVGFYQGEGAGLRLGEEFHHNRVQLVSSQIGGVPPVLAGRWDQDRLNHGFLALAAAGSIDPVGLVSHIVPVDQAAQAYELLDRSPEDALQVVLEF